MKNIHMIKGINLRKRHNNCIYIYTPNIGGPKYIKQILKDVKREIHRNTILGDFNIPLNINEQITQTEYQ